MAGRLSTPRQRLSFAPASARYLSKAQPSGPAPTQQSAPWRNWYKLARWLRLREKVLLRDHYTCQWPGCGRVLGGKSPADDSPVVDHIRAHRGDEVLFWSEDNLQSLCKSPCHDRHKQALEQLSRGQAGIWD